MEPTIRASLLWGVVGVLCFLVGIQAYHLVRGEFVGLAVVLGVAAGVGVTTAGLARVLRPHSRR